MLPQSSAYFTGRLPREIREETERFRKEGQITLEVEVKEHNYIIVISMNDDEGNILRIELISIPFRLLRSFLVQISHIMNNEPYDKDYSFLFTFNPQYGSISFDEKEKRFFLYSLPDHPPIFKFNQVYTQILLRKLTSLERDIILGKYR